MPKKFERARQPRRIEAQASHDHHTSNPRRSRPRNLASRGQLPAGGRAVGLLQRRYQAGHRGWQRQQQQEGQQKADGRAATIITTTTTSAISSTKEEARRVGWSQGACGNQGKRKYDAKTLAD